MHQKGFLVGLEEASCYDVIGEGHMAGSLGFEGLDPMIIRR